MARMTGLKEKKHSKPDTLVQRKQGFSLLAHSPFVTLEKNTASVELALAQPWQKRTFLWKTGYFSGVCLKVSHQIGGKGRGV